MARCSRSSGGRACRVPGLLGVVGVFFDVASHLSAWYGPLTKVASLLCVRNKARARHVNDYIDACLHDEPRRTRPQCIGS